jgi:Flp pilus assembly pilin Flp
LSSRRRFLNEEDGQDMIEYGLVISLVVVGGAAAYVAFQGEISNALNTLGSSITSNL